MGATGIMKVMKEAVSVEEAAEVGYELCSSHPHIHKMSCFTLDILQKSAFPVICF